MQRRNFLKVFGAAATLLGIPGGAATLAGATPVAAAAPVAAATASSMNPMIPEMWAKESLRILQERTVVANLVHKDFGDEYGRCKDRINTARSSV